jgi:cell division protein FtsW (lipid II flippase)
VLKIFPILDDHSSRDRIQSRLMVIAALLLIAYALILSLAPAIRFHAESGNYRLDHWLGVIIWFGVFSFIHHQSTRRLPARDPYIVPIISLLTGLGLMTIWRLFPALGLRQTIWLVIASLVVFAGLQFPAFLQALRRYKYIWLVSGLILTALTIVMGENPTGAGPKLWLKLFGIYFQPSEPLKLLLIAYLAAYFTDRPAVRYRFLESLLPTLAIAGMALGLLVSQQDLGTASIFLMIYLAMLYTAQGKNYILWVSPLLILLAGVIGYFQIGVVRIRIDTWLAPFADPSGAAYQVIQSMIAIAEGGMIGAGPGLGSPGLIPVSISDFIFSAIAEEMGLLGVTGLIILYTVLIFRGVKISTNAQSTFHRFLALGLTFYFGIQSILIIGGNIGLLPLTGVTLPFVSYGGSSLVVSFGAMLILLTISHHSGENQSRKPTPHPRYVWLSGLLLGVLIVEIIATSLLSFWQSPELITRLENPRWVVYDRFQERGNILDRNNEIIMSNTGEVGSYQRISSHHALYPVIGYTSGIYGQTGIEMSMYPFLRGLEGYPYDDLFWQDLLYNQPPVGLNVRLTLDLKLQRKADALLGEENGAILLMNADSGEILVMASHPYFNAATLEEDWEALINDPDAPLVNRATQGKYPPGTALFPLILSQQVNRIDNTPLPGDLLPKSSLTESCALPVESDPTWQQLAAAGCSEALNALMVLISPQALFDHFLVLGLAEEPPIRLSVAEIEAPLDFTDIMGSANGDTELNISPLQIALAASAITHQGILPAPRIVNGYQSPEGAWITLPKLSENRQAIPQNQADFVSQLLAVPESPYWQVTARVLAEEEQVISWFVAGTTAAWQGQPFTIVVVLETDNPEKAESIGFSLLQEMTQ